MTNNPPPTRSTSNDNCLSALEVRNHSLQRQFDTHRDEIAKEFTNIKESMEALSNAIARMGRRLDSQDSDNQNSGSASKNHELETGSANRNNRTKVSNGGTTGGIQTRFS